MYLRWLARFAEAGAPWVQLDEPALVSDNWDVPAEDLVLRRVAAGGDTALTTKALSMRAEAWRPWRSYAAMQLWAGLPGKRRDR